MPEAAHFYLDESMLAKSLADALEAKGHPVHRCGDEVPRGLPDKEWLNLLGDRNWIVLLRDQRIRFNQLEREQLVASKLGVFIFTGGQVTGLETTRVITSCLSKILAIDAAESRPYVFTITRAGTVTRAGWR